MNIAWSIGFQSWYFSFAPLHTRVAWFIGAIIGGLLSCFVANKLPKKIVFVSMPASWPEFSNATSLSSSSVLLLTSCDDRGSPNGSHD